MMTSEAILQEQVANYLVLQYPDVMFHSDFGSGAKLTPAQAAKQKRQNGGRVGWPDMFIAEAMTDYRYSDHDKDGHFIGGIKLVRSRLIDEMYHYGFEDVCYNHTFGLFLELKKDGTRLKKKNGEWATPHIAEQSKILEQLRQHGYRAEFAVGFDEAKRIIDEYLGGKNE